jgi:hypothetical protein
MQAGIGVWGSGQQGEKRGRSLNQKKNKLAGGLTAY